MRLGVIAMTFTALAMAVPGGAGAVVIGADVHEFSSSQQICTQAPHCSFVQTSISGETTKAPFSGRIKRWRVQEPYGTLWIQVMKKKANGEFKAIRSSAAETITTADESEVVRFGSNLRIRKGQYVGIATDDFYSSRLNGITTVGLGCRKGFVPGLATGESAAPNPSYSGCSGVLLYNATLKH